MFLLITESTLIIEEEMPQASFITAIIIIRLNMSKNKAEDKDIATLINDKAQFSFNSLLIYKHSISRLILILY